MDVCGPSAMFCFDSPRTVPEGCCRAGLWEAVCCVFVTKQLGKIETHISAMGFNVVCGLGLLKEGAFVGKWKGFGQVKCGKYKLDTLFSQLSQKITRHSKRVENR